MAHQSSVEKAHPVSFDPQPEPVDTLPLDHQPPGVDEEEEETQEYQSLEEALLGE